jgi:serine/threonine protein kinase, bacterial
MRLIIMNKSFVVFLGLLALIIFSCKRTNNIPSPVITDFTPSSDTVGAKVYITGENFSSNIHENLVSINGTSAEVVSASGTSLSIIVPPGANSDYFVLNVNGLKTQSTKKFIVLATENSPSITKVSPDTSIIGGTVTITGKNLGNSTNEDSVWFDGVLATLSSVSPTEISVIVPIKALTGKIKISVNKKIATTSNDFVVPAPTITGFTPASDTAGAVITITGTNFYFDLDYDSVKFNGLNAVISSATNTTMVVTIPRNAVTGKVSVTVGVQTVVSSQSFIIPAPVITSYQNTSDTVGALVTITGANFYTDMTRDTVRFNNIPATVISATANQLIVKVPEAVISGPITLKINGQTATATPDFTVVGVSTLAGTQNIGYKDGIGPDALFGVLWGIGSDQTGSLYVYDNPYERIRKISPTGEVTTIAGSGQIGSDDGTADMASFNSVIALTVDPQGNVYAVDKAAQKIRKISTAGIVSTLATDINLFGIAVDASGDIFFTAYNNAIKKITPDGTISLFAGGNPEPGYVDGNLSDAQFNLPGALTFDRDGNLYVSDNYRIRKITPAGIVTTLAGTGQQGLSENGQGTQASFYSVWSMVTDSKNNLFVIDFNAVRKITPSGYVSTYSGSLTAGFQNGGLSGALYNQPNGITVDANDNLFIADQGNLRVRKIVPY